ncbi:MAG: MMPL family transporter [Nanoarchaeota archaeon]|nr:MMPL family transporter [Nanoarchaeota archaeon]
MDWYHNLLKKLAHAQVQYPYFVILIIIGLTLIMTVGSSQVQTVASLELMMPDYLEPIAAFNTLRDQGLGQDIIAVVVTLDTSSSLTYLPDGSIDINDYLLSFEKNLRENTDVLEVYSAANSPYPEQFITPDGKGTVLLISTDIGTQDSRMKALVGDVEALSKEGLPAGYSVALTGTPSIQQKLGELIGNDRKNTQLYSTLFVFIILILTFGTFSSAVVPLLVVTTSVTWLYGTMGFVGLPISTLAGGVAAMVIGIGIDFAIHIINKFKFERKKGMTIPHAIEAAVVHTGTSLTITSATTVAAFLAFMAGIMPEMARFGILMSLGITYSLLFSIVGLPAALIVEERILSWISKKGHFGVEGEYRLEK